ncbi:MAG: hypothetical protein MK108_12745 [Mariniblastus sp.]|nr:hypothetical protein [Mariniblastus sp.]
MNPFESAKVELDSLVGIFFEENQSLGLFKEVTADQMPEPFQALLNHDTHMTVTVEKYHSSQVDIRVLQTDQAGATYAREILLSRQTDQQVVQYGIVRLNFDYLGEPVQQEIESQEVPLGRVLIEHDVMRKVKLLSLYEVNPGPALVKALGIDATAPCYGRTAMIFCDDQPAIELLEIVTA